MVRGVQASAGPVTALNRRATAQPARAPRRRLHAAGVGLIAGLSAAAYAVYSVVNHAHFGTTVYDAVIFDQAVRGYSTFGAQIGRAHV